ncbi:Cyclic pyranopterin monophosphate synthase [Pirellulimonas nuda]|uniref:GTP 3',8-cyclase n=1 Tax=Pirellulimonas nuda TaxID=2528009 RepID=A0A518DFA2_9BACT|nr:GTP 3',8-cyclase MoaA [Pirellulimonas nuda]QDU90138.1 Cyclic pyranopterin monophosphate synthase [Pirellulimonas nuda]
MHQLTDQPIDVAALVAQVNDPRAGAAVLMLGVTREWTGDLQTTHLSYEAHRSLAEAELARLESEARERWPLVGCWIVHRLGEVPLGQTSVAIAASSPHRDDAFAAARWLIDTLKQRVPIWKQENFADGQREWVHPGVVAQNAAAQDAAPTAEGGVMDPKAQPLIDRFGRAHASLRISVTDRCNIRCRYCMPGGAIRFLPKAELLSFEEIARVAGVLAGLGVTRLRLTGGEPLVRSGLARLVAMLAATPGVEDLALTTNGMLLDDQAEALRDAGLRRLNISLDTLREATFQELTRREGLDRVLAGIAAAQRAGFSAIRLNALAIRGLNEDEIVPLGRFAIERGLELRFIEYMPLDADGAWARADVLTGAEVRAKLEEAFGPLEAAPRHDASQPATDYCFARGGGRIGFINPVSEPFCGACDRLRLTAEGQLRNCLFSTEEWNVRDLLRSAADDAAIAQLARECVDAKHAGHGIDSPEFLKPARAMYQIGG